MALLRGGQFGAALKDHGLGGGLLALALGNQGLGGEDGVLRLAYLGAGLVELGLQHFGVHARDDLAGLDEVAFVDADLADAPAELGRHVDLGSLDAPVAAGESVAQAIGAQLGPGQQADDDQRDECEQHPAKGFLGWGFHGRSLIVKQCWHAKRWAGRLRLA